MLYLSSQCAGERSIARAVNGIADMGIANIELTGGTAYETYDQAGLLALKSSLELDFLIHNYFPPKPDDFVLSPASRDPKTKARTWEAVSESLALARIFGRDLYSMHAGFCRDLEPVSGNDGLFTPTSKPLYGLEDLLTGVEEMADALLPPDCRMAVENAFPTSDGARFSLLASPDDIFAFLRHFSPRGNVGLLLDLGHLGVAAARSGFGKAPFLERLLADWGHLIFEIHVSANDGSSDRHGVNSAADPDIVFLKRARDVLKETPIVLEWHGGLSPAVAKAYFDIADFLEL